MLELIMYTGQKSGAYAFFKVYTSINPYIG